MTEPKTKHFKIEKEETQSKEDKLRQLAELSDDELLDLLLRLPDEDIEKIRSDKKKITEQDYGNS